MNLTTRATLLTAALLGAASAQTPTDPTWVLFGTRATAPIALPGVAGRLGLHPDGLVAMEPGLPERLTNLSRGAAAPWFAQGLTLPLGGGPRLLPLATLGGSVGGALPQSAVKLPQEPIVTLTLKVQPIHDSFTRYLTFTGMFGEVKRQPIAFTKTAHLVYTGSFPEGIAELQSLAEQGNRHYWDRMSLENRGGSTALAIAKLEIKMVYTDVPAGFKRRIAIVDATLARTLGAGYTSLDLNTVARDSRLAWAGITAADHAVVQLAAEDFGKSGTDTMDPRAPWQWNPKYNPGEDNLCSEFVSWYFHEAGLVVDGNDFNDITSSGTLHDIFVGASRAYRYHQGRGEFVHADTEASYTPRSGDWLERREDGEDEHSMIVLRWDPVTKIATVINGPWPVTLRDIDIHNEEVLNGKDYWLGKVPR